MVLANVGSDVQRTEVIKPERALTAGASGHPAPATGGAPTLRIEEARALDERRPEADGPA